MKISKYSLIVFLCSILFIVLVTILDLKLFNSDEPDGFYYQLLYVSKIFQGDLDLTPLFFVHLLRLFIVLPFYILDVFDLPALFGGIFYLIYLSPILKSKPSRTIEYLKLLIIFFPIAFSYRAALGMCAMAYLYLILFCGYNSARVLLASAMLANLSSGIVLSWALAVMGSYKYLNNRFRAFRPVVFVLGSGFAGAVLHKFEFMLSSHGASANGSFLERSTLYVSYHYQQYSRLVLYTALVMVLYFILVSLPAMSRYNGRKFLFFFAALPGLFFEGLGFISYLMCFILFFIDSFSSSTLRIHNAY